MLNLLAYWTLNILNPVNTRRYLDVNSTFYERHGRQMDVKIMLCACIWTCTTRRFLDVNSTFFWMLWTSKRRCVLTGREFVQNIPLLWWSFKKMIHFKGNICNVSKDVLLLSSGEAQLYFLSACSSKYGKIIYRWSFN